MALGIGAYNPSLTDTRAAELANAQTLAGANRPVQVAQAEPVADTPALRAHRGSSGFDGSAANAIRPQQPGMGHNGGPPMPGSTLTGPTLPSHTADPARGSYDPRDLTEQQAVNQARANPAGGREIIPANQVNDPRFRGYAKYEQTIQTAQGQRTVHYMYNPQTGHATDFKITGQPPTMPRDVSQRHTANDGRQYGVGRDGQIYRYHADGRFDARVNLRDVPNELRNRIGMTAMNRAWRHAMRRGGIRGNE